MQCADHTASAELLGMAERSVMLAMTSGCTAGSRSTRSCVQPSNIAGRRPPPKGPQPALTTRAIIYLWLSRKDEAPLSLLRARSGWPFASFATFSTAALTPLISVSLQSFRPHLVVTATERRERLRQSPDCARPSPA